MEIGRASFMGQAQSLLGVVAREAGQIAGTELGREVGKLLGQLVGSAFTGSTEGKPLDPNQRFESPISRFGGQLQQLGITAQTLGEVLGSLTKLIGNDRGLANSSGVGDLSSLLGGTPLPFSGDLGGLLGGPQLPFDASGDLGSILGPPTATPAQPSGAAPVGPGSLSNAGANDVMQFGGDLDQRQKDQIAFQQKMQKQTEAFSLITNILKMLSDSTKQFYGNLK